MRATQLLRRKEFFARHAVFRAQDFADFYMDAGRRQRQGCVAVLKKHVVAGDLVIVKRALYATVPPGIATDSVQVDPYLLATKLADDAVVAFHAALQFHGAAFSVWKRFDYLSRMTLSRFAYHDAKFLSVRPTPALRSLPDMGGLFVESPRPGGVVRVTSRERTFVDVLHAPRRCGDWPEVWRSLAMFDLLDLDVVVGFVELIGSALTAAHVGYFLEQHREQFAVGDSHLEALRQFAPRKVRHFDSRNTPGTLAPGWNVLVPRQIRLREWDDLR